MIGRTLRRLSLFALVMLAPGCAGSGTVIPESSSEDATPTTQVTPSPTPDAADAYQAAVCDVIDPLIMAAGEQMAPALDALADDDRQAAARERAQLDVVVGDVRAVIEGAPEYPDAHVFETRLLASMDAFLDGLDAFELGKRNLDADAMAEATGMFEVSGDLFDEATAEFAVIC